MLKYWKLILLAIVVIGVLYFLTRPMTEGLTSNPPVENPLPGQGPMAGQGATMALSPVVPSPSTSGTALTSAPATVPPSTTILPSVDNTPLPSPTPLMPQINPAPAPSPTTVSATPLPKEPIGHIRYDLDNVTRSVDNIKNTLNNM